MQTINWLYPFFIEHCGRLRNWALPPLWWLCNASTLNVMLFGYEEGFL